MYLTDFGINEHRRKTCIVLGAGATRGASFVEDGSQPLPPLDIDFFQQIARISNDRHSTSLLKFVRDEFGHEVGVSMEEFYSQADYTDRFHRELKIDGSSLVRRYEEALKDFYSVLPRLLNQTTSAECKYHRMLASRLHADDSVISFNYDCLMDRAIRDSIPSKWDPVHSYGFRVHGETKSWVSPAANVGRRPQTPVRLLKMHGSMNWVVEQQSRDVRLVGSMQEVESLEGSIIPPTWFKILQEPPFSNVWKEARLRVRGARVMVVVGYSVPETDLFSKSLFKVESGAKAENESLRLLVVVNPDRSARKRFIDLVSKGIDSETTILEYETMEDLYNLLKRCSEQGRLRDRVEKYETSISPSVVQQGESYKTTVSIRGQLHNAFFDNLLKHRETKEEKWHPDYSTLVRRNDLKSRLTPGILDGDMDLEEHTYEKSTEGLQPGTYDVFVQVWEHAKEGEPKRDKLIEKKHVLTVK